jgi:Protein of unknown function (DUF3093)
VTQQRERYRERLYAPPSWWAVCTALVVTLAVAVGYPLGLPAGLVTAALAGGAVAWVLVSAAAQVLVTDDALCAGRARLPRCAVGTVTALDGVESGRLRGPGADARAYLLLRPWLTLAVRVDVEDPADPTPYWYVATRRPQALAAALSLPAGGPDGPDRPDGAG